MTSAGRNDGNPWGRLVLADALTLAQSLEGGAVDLVYLDPPFGTGAARAMLRGRGGKFLADRNPAAKAPAHSDPPPGRDLAYVDPRVDADVQMALWQEVRRILRPGGAFFLHLDWRAVHRAKLLLDDIFGADNFLNEIIWHYATGGIPARWFARKHDTLLFYVNGPGHTFRRLKEKKYLAHKMSRKGVPEYRDERGWYRYRFLDDVWEIPWLTQDSKERTGYPTQKPVALLTRILEACTVPDDLVADLCCGSGTTAVAAHRLGRRWIAGDESPRAFEIAGRRLHAEGAVPLDPEDWVDGATAGDAAERAVVKRAAAALTAAARTAATRMVGRPAGDGSESEDGPAIGSEIRYARPEGESVAPDPGAETAPRDGSEDLDGDGADRDGRESAHE